MALALFSRKNSPPPRNKSTRRHYLLVSFCGREGSPANSLLTCCPQPLTPATLRSRAAPPRAAGTPGRPLPSAGRRRQRARAGAAAACGGGGSGAGAGRGAAGSQLGAGRERGALSTGSCWRRWQQQQRRGPAEVFSADPSRSLGSSCGGADIPVGCVLLFCLFA